MIKIFGCECFASTLSYSKTKLDPRARQGIYLGHKPGIKGYIVFDIKTKEFLVSRNVVFHENCFPFQQQTGSESDKFIYPSSSDTHSAYPSDIAYLFPFPSYSPSPSSQPEPPPSSQTEPVSPYILIYNLIHHSLSPHRTCLSEGPLEPRNCHLICRTFITIWPPLQLLMLLLQLLNILFHSIYHITISPFPISISSFPFPPPKNLHLIMRQLD